MAILAVAQQGEQILTLKAQEIIESEINSFWLEALVASMQETMLARNGVGIAAPQIYVSKRVIIIASRPNPRYPDAPEMQAIAMVNPEIIKKSEQMILGEEGCLSVPDTRGQVARSDDIAVRYFTITGEEKYLELSGFPARIVQHEIDHLDGILFVERL